MSWSSRNLEIHSLLDVVLGIRYMYPVVDFCWKKGAESYLNDGAPMWRRATINRDLYIRYFQYPSIIIVGMNIAYYTGIIVIVHHNYSYSAPLP